MLWPWGYYLLSIVAKVKAENFWSGFCPLEFKIEYHIWEKYMKQELNRPEPVTILWVYVFWFSSSALISENLVTSSEDKINVWYLWENKRGLFSKQFPFCAKMLLLITAHSNIPSPTIFKIVWGFCGYPKVLFCCSQWCVMLSIIIKFKNYYHGVYWTLSLNRWFMNIWDNLVALKWFIPQLSEHMATFHHLC